MGCVYWRVNCYNSGQISNLNKFCFIIIDTHVSKLVSLQQLISSIVSNSTELYSGYTENIITGWLCCGFFGIITGLSSTSFIMQSANSHDFIIYYINTPSIPLTFCPGNLIWYTETLVLRFFLSFRRFALLSMLTTSFTVM